MQNVRIQNADMAWHIAAHIQLPPGFDESKRYPTVVSVHPFGSCREQTSGNVYGKALAEEGYVVIAYDASFQGIRRAPRWVEDPTQRVEDISRVIDYAVTLPYVDAERIGVLGICGGGGYAVNATLTEKRIKAVVSITGVNIGRLFREGFSGYDPLAALNAMAAQRTLRGGELQVNELLPASPEAATAHGLTERDVLKPRTTTRPRAASSRAGRRACCSHMRKNAGLGCLRVCRGAADSAGDGGGGEKVGAFGAYRDGMEVYGRATASQHRELVSLADFTLRAV